MERLLAVFAHPDDEASCVGTLANHSDAGDAVRLLWLSRGENATTLAMDREEDPGAGPAGERLAPCSASRRAFSTFQTPASSTPGRTPSS